MNFSIFGHPSQIRLESKHKHLKQQKFGFAFGALTTLFFIWGFITVLVDAFIPRLKEVFELSYAEAGLVQVAWFLAYLLVSIPGGVLVSRLGYKKGIIGGLLIAGLGCALFYPAAHFRLFPLFLLALFVLAGGITILQVAANPFVAVLGSEDKAASRLNLSQAFNSLGTTIAPILSATYLLSDSIQTSDQIAEMSPEIKATYYASEASAVQGPFLWLASALVVVALGFAIIKLPKILDHVATDGMKKALQNKGLKLGVIGIFVYVGAEVAIGSYLTNYFMSMNLDSMILSSPEMRSIAHSIANTFKGTDIATMDGKGVVGLFVIFYWGGAMIGRFVGSYLTRIMNPSRVLAIFGSIAIGLLLITMMSSGYVAMFSALAIGLFNSIMFPTIFTNTLEGMGDLKPQASGLLCTAIFGGAVIPPLFGLMIDGIGFKMAFMLPVLCYAYIIYLALYQRQRILS